MHIALLKEPAPRIHKRIHSLSEDFPVSVPFPSQHTRSHVLFWKKVGERNPTKKSAPHSILIQDLSTKPIILPVQLHGIPIRIWNPKKSTFSPLCEGFLERRVLSNTYLILEELDRISFERTAKCLADEMKEEEEHARESRRLHERKLSIEQHELKKQEARLERMKLHA